MFLHDEYQSIHYSFQLLGFTKEDTAPIGY